MTTIRRREVGIRKTFGASGGSIVTLLSREVFVLIMISSSIAYPVAWFGVRLWLESFSEKIKVSPFIFIIASFLGLATGLFSIIYQALKAASCNPVEALKNK